MGATTDSEAIDRHRRRFLSTAMTVAAAELGLFGAANAEAGRTTPKHALPGKSGKHTRSAPSSRSMPASSISDTPKLVPPTVRRSFFHGWPYDVHSYVDVAPLLASAGYRVVVPYLRGYGTTRFLSAARSATANRRWSPSTSLR